MRVFVTGSTGLLGNNLIRALESAGYSVRGLVRSLEKGRRLLGDTADEARRECAPFTRPCG
jgi:dihydroflavonol-4-reductase